MRRGNTNNNKKNMNRKRPPSPLHIGVGDDVIASRTRRKKREMTAKWDIPIPIIIQVASWLDQDSLMNLSIVSKQLHNIICNEPGNKNKIIPVFEVSGNSIYRLLCNLRDHFLNKDTANKLQCYPIMRVKDVHKFDTTWDHTDTNHIFEFKKQIVENIQMKGITSLDLSTQSPQNINDIIVQFLPDFLPNLREVDVSNTSVRRFIFFVLSENCPLLEKITSHNNNSGFSSCGYDMCLSDHLKEINMDNSLFIVYYADKNRIADISNHQEIFIFHMCCKSLERVSIRNAKYRFIGGDDEDDDSDDDSDDNDDEQILTFAQNSLIKFVRNAPSSMRWFRSDLTPDNMTMLRLERPEIELLN